jgi:acid phosphatase (class A)
MYTRVFGEGFNPQALPKIAHLFARVGESEDAVVDPAKPFYGRIRPWLANPEIKALVKPTKSGAYPSGHTTRVAAVATILTAMAPEMRDAVWARASEYAESRVVGGMHYWPDIEAGWRAGAALAAAIMANADFKSDFPAAREELRRSLRLGD